MTWYYYWYTLIYQLVCYKTYHSNLGMKNSQAYILAINSLLKRWKQLNFIS